MGHSSGSLIVVAQDIRSSQGGDGLRSGQVSSHCWYVGDVGDAHVCIADGQSIAESGKNVVYYCTHDCARPAISSQTDQICHKIGKWEVHIIFWADQFNVLEPIHSVFLLEGRGFTSHVIL